MKPKKENSNSISLDVIKQEKVPVEESFSIINSEEKSFISNCISSLDNFDKRISSPLQTCTTNLFIELFLFIFAKSFNTITVILYLVFLLFWSFNHSNFKKNNKKRKTNFNSEKIFFRSKKKRNNGINA